MRPRNHAWAGAVIAFGLISLTACGGSGGAGGSSAKPAVLVDGSLTMAVASDPGGFDPAASYTSSSRQLFAFLYDTLVSVVDGKVEPQLASSWEESPTSVTFTLKEGVTCSDGTDLTAEDVAANLNYAADPKNGSPLSGLAVPIGSKTTASDDTVTLKTAQPTGFLTQMLSLVPIVCKSGLANRESLTSTPNGTGPYTIKNAVAGAQYVLQRRAGYAWGPNGHTTSAAGVPATVTLKVISNQTTLANSLLSGAVNIGAVSGPDAERLSAGKHFSQSWLSMWGEFIYNQSPGRSLAAEPLRKGLTQALDTDQLLSVSTSGEGKKPTSLLADNVCEGATVVGNLPTYDPDAAKRALTPLRGQKLTLIYSSTTMGQQGAAGAELAASMWKAAGVDVEVRALSTPDLFDTLYKGGDWDIVWFPVDGEIPQQAQNSFGGTSATEGGNNFAEIDNAEYDELSTKAIEMPGDTGCSDWLKAEAALMRASDVLPFSLSVTRMWGVKATFNGIFHVVEPTSIRMTR